MRKNNFVILISAIILVACTSNEVYFSYKSPNEKGWSKDSLLNFDVSISDTLSNYNVFVNIRNTHEYSYQNLWIFINKISPDKSMAKDSIELFLADKRGNWLGSGVGSILEMPVLYQQKMHFKKAGIYHYQILQGMRDEQLKGIHDVGIRIEKIVTDN
jgi:gliding motility-associated lipoprotein GldH